MTTPPTSTILRRPIAGAIAALACLSLAVSAQAASAQTLEGTHLERVEHPESLFVIGTCNADGPSTFDYHSYGAATGTIPGSYEVHGEFTLASPTGPVTALSGTFAVHGDEIDPSGTQTLADSVSATCNPQDDSVEILVNTTYSVLDPFAEQGPAATNIGGAGSDWGTVFTVDFGQEVSPPPPPPPAAPTSKADCLDGGWRDYAPMFKNQGDCISYVSRLGKKA